MRSKFYFLWQSLPTCLRPQSPSFLVPFGKHSPDFAIDVLFIFY